MRLKCFCYVVTLLTIGGAGRPASADQVAPLVPQMTPAKPGPIILRFHDALAEGLKAGGLSIVDPAQVRLKLKLPPENAGCAEGPCVATAARALGEGRLATAKITTVGKNYEIEVQIFSAKQSKLGSAQGRCDICTLSEALRATKRVATEVGSKAEEPPADTPPVPAVTAPPASPVPTPVPKDPEPAPPTTAEPPVAPPAATTPPVSDSGTPPLSDGVSKPRWPLWPALAALGVGVVGLSAGIPLLAIDGDPTNCSGPARPDTKNCADLYDTAAGGWVMTGVGIVAVAASGILFYLHLARGGRPEQGAPQVAVVPLEGGMVLGAQGSF